MNDFNSKETGPVIPQQRRGKAKRNLFLTLTIIFGLFVFILVVAIFEDSEAVYGLLLLLPLFILFLWLFIREEKKIHVKNATSSPLATPSAAPYQTPPQKSGSTAASNMTSPSDPQKMKTVLLVDDTDFMRKSQRDILSKHGYTVVGEAKNGIEAVGMYKELKPELVIMDIDMPEMDGLRQQRKSQIMM